MRSSVLPAALLALLLTGCGTTSTAPEKASGPTTRTQHDRQHDRPQGWPAPVEMHSFTAPATRDGNRATTYGLGDLDGDGRADMVQVRTDGRVTAELTWLGHRAARLPADPTLRLQGLPDLDGDGRAEVLVASTAAGCCDAHRPSETRSAVLVVDHGRLLPLRWATGRPTTIRFDQGRGDAYAGVSCAGRTLHLLAALAQGPTAHLTDTPVAVSGAVAQRGPAASRTIASGTVRAETRTRCPGLDAQGWAG